MSPFVYMLTWIREKVMKIIIIMLIIFISYSNNMIIIFVHFKRLFNENNYYKKTTYAAQKIENFKCWNGLIFYL